MICWPKNSRNRLVIRLCAAATLVLTACTAGQKPEPFTQLTMDDIRPVIANTVSPQTREWERYVLDVQVVTPQGERLPLTQTGGSISVAGDRNLKVTGSFGSDHAHYQTQGNVGLWLHEALGRERARIFIDVGWPKSHGKIPANLNDAGVHVLSARLYCESWAQALAAHEQSPPDYRRLKEILSDHYVDQKLDATLPIPAYPVGEFWVIPVQVTLPSARFTSECF